MNQIVYIKFSAHDAFHE